VGNKLRYIIFRVKHIILRLQLTEAEFRAKGRSLALPPEDISVFISPSYSQVRIFSFDL
jgi:hypothetical protein